MKKNIYYLLLFTFVINKTFSGNNVKDYTANGSCEEKSLVASVSISQTSGTNPMCAGANASFTATPTNGGLTPSYQWKINGANVGADNPVYSSSSLTTGQIVTCVMTSSLGGVTGSPATSNSITMTVNPIPATPVASNTGPFCTGTTIALNTDEVSGATYSWTGPSSFSSALQNPVRLSCTTAMAGTYSLTVTVAGCTSMSATTNVVVHSTPATPVAKINASTSPPAICSGGTITLTTPSVSGATYNWSGPSGYSSTVRNPAALTGATVSMGGTYSVTVTVSGCTSLPGTVSITINPTPSTPTIISNSPVCTGSSINLTTATVSGASYSWTGPASFSSTLQNPTRASATISMSGTYSLTETVAGCTSASGTTSVSVNSSLTPAISVLASPSGTICEGTPVTFSATPVNGGTTPSYQWQVNGSNVGTDTSVYSSSLLTNGQTITCVLTSGISCASPATATSSAITMSVNPTVTPTVDISIGSGSNPMCAGQVTTFFASISHGGSSPSYQWQVNGANAGVNLATFTSATLNNGDVVTCTLTSNAPCASPLSITSAPITMTVNPIVTPSVGISIDSGSNPMCAGQSITFIAADTNGGLAPSHQWQVNGINAGSDLPTFSPPVINDSDIVVCILTSDDMCSSVPTATSEEILMNVIPSVTPSLFVSIGMGTNPMCSGAPITFVSADTNAGTAPSYEWKINGFTVGTDTIFSPAGLNNGDIVSCTLTSSATCATPSSVTGDPITMIINPTPSTPSITIVDSSLVSSSPSGNQWYLNDTLIPGANDQSYLFSENGTYTVIVTAGPCSSDTSAPMIILNTGILSHENSNALSIYPNPGGGIFTISFQSSEKMDWRLRLTNVLGQNIYEDVYPDFEGIFAKQLDISNYGKGVYTLSLTNGKNEIVKKIIVY